MNIIINLLLINILSSSNLLFSAYITHSHKGINMKVINKEVISLKELNRVYNRLAYGKHNVFKGNKSIKLETCLFPVYAAYVDLIDNKNNYRIHYTIKSEQ